MTYRKRQGSPVAMQDALIKKRLPLGLGDEIGMQSTLGNRRSGSSHLLPAEGLELNLKDYPIKYDICQ